MSGIFRENEKGKRHGIGIAGQQEAGGTKKSKKAKGKRDNEGKKGTNRSAVPGSFISTGSSL